MLLSIMLPRSKTLGGRRRVFCVPARFAAGMQVHELLQAQIPIRYDGMEARPVLWKFRQTRSRRIDGRQRDSKNGKTDSRHNSDVLGAGGVFAGFVTSADAFNDPWANRRGRSAHTDKVGSIR